MKIYVCVKHAADSAVLAEDGRIEERDPYFNPYDLHAVQAAVELAAQADEIVAVTAGRGKASATLERAMAMGAGRAIHVVTKRPLDAVLTARGLAAAIRRDGGGDLALTGARSVDSQGSQVPYRLAANLGWQVASDVAALAHEDSGLTVECEREAGARQVLRLALPCVVGVSKALNEPRNPTLPQLLKARRQGVETLSWDELAVEEGDAGTEILELRPAVGPRRGVILDGDPEEAVAELLRRLREEAQVL